MQDSRSPCGPGILRPSSAGRTLVTTAAQFLQRHVGNTPWAHIDISGVWTDTDKPTVPEGATAYGVRLLDRLVRNNYEG